MCKRKTMPLHKYNTIYNIFWDCTVHCRFSTAIFIFQSLLHIIMLTLRCAIQHDVMFTIFLNSISLLNPTFLVLNERRLQDSTLFHLGAKCMMIVHNTLYAV